MTDKIGKNIQNSMLDDLLPEDKSKKPEPPRQTYNNSYNNSGRSFSRGRDFQPSMLDDDGPDPMDDAYYGAGSNATGRSTAGGSSVFDRKTTHSYGRNTIASGTGDVGALIAEEVAKLHFGRNEVFMDAAQTTKIVELMMKGIGQMLDQAGITWGTKGLTMMREMLKDFLPLTYVDGKAVATMDDDGVIEDGEAAGSHYGE